MTSLPERLFPLWRRATLVLLLALVASCGPGTGGTGTGPISFSADLGLSTAAPGSIGTAGGALACAGCSRIDLQLDDQRIELRLPCGRFVYEGAWNPDATELTLAGTFQPPGAAASAPATLQLQFGSEGARSNQVVIRLSDASGATLAVSTLQRQAGQALPAACP
jgi:hypothetical protein